jgi:predicted permease
MGRLRNFKTGLGALADKRRVERELEEELEGFLDASVIDKRRRGMDAEAAWRAARVEMGSRGAVKHQVWSSRWEAGVDGWMQDLRVAVRVLLKSRGFTAVAVLILALGIGANVAVFSVVNRIVLRPLPFLNAERMVWLEPGKNLDPKLRVAAGLSGKTWDVDGYQTFARTAKSFARLTSFNPFLGNSEYTLTGMDGAQGGGPGVSGMGASGVGVSGVMVEENFFETLGVRPQMGRLFTHEEAIKGGRAAVLLSDGFWRAHFHADAGIMGQVVQLNKQPYTVIGVMPASFDFGAVFAPGLKFDVFTPALLGEMRSWGNTLSVVGVLRPGVSVAEAQAETDTVFHGINLSRPEIPVDLTPTVSGLKEQVSGGLRRSMTVLWLAVGMVLLIVCVNLSSLLVARATARTKEFAMRAALGAGRGRLVRQLLAESLVLAVTGAVLGLGFAFGITTYLARQTAVAVPLLNGVRLDGAAVGWALLLTLAVTVVFGLLPAMRLRDRDLQSALKDGGHGTSNGGRQERLRSALVIAEVAITCVLLVGAGLLLRSFLKTLDEDLGFQPERAAVMQVDFEQGASGEKRAQVLWEMIERVRGIPGVEAAGEADMLPLEHNRSWMFSAKEHPLRKGEIEAAMVRVITPGYLGAMGMRLLEGRDFRWEDVPEQTDRKTKLTTGGPDEVIINQAAARYFWPGEDALGKRAVLDGGDIPDATVVGVIDDVRQTSVETKAGPEFFVPVRQSQPEGAQLVVRSALPAATLEPSVLAAVRQVNAGQPAYALRPLGSVVDHAVSPRRFLLVLVMSFAGLGLGLASLGIYGVIAYSVVQRTQEIGIRMALGSSAEAVQRGVMTKALRLAGLGVAAGTVAALALVRGMQALLYGTQATDPLTYAGMVVLLLLVAALAGYLPARRAARINPAVALRGQ